MKNKTLLLLLLCAIPAATSVEGGSSSTVGKDAAGVALLMPQIETDFSDLDVRDAQNNKIQSYSASQQLEALFRENIVNLVVFATPHTMTEVLNWLDTFSHLFNRLILARVLAVFEFFQDAFMPPTRRFVHNVHNLCITFSVEHSVSRLQFAVSRSLQTANLLNLRC
jgi:hypothetical protein